MTDYSREGVARLDELFGQRMKTLRDARRMPQQHIANTMTMVYGHRWYQTTVGKIESGTRPVKLTEAVAVAAILGVPLEDLLTENPEASHGPSQEALRQATISGRLHEAMRMSTAVSDRIEHLSKQLREATGGEDDPGA